VQNPNRNRSDEEKNDLIVKIKKIRQRLSDAYYMDILCSV